MQKNRKFYITALIIPKQESTSDSVRFSFTINILENMYYYYSLNITSVIVLPEQCQTTNEEEIFEVQDKRSLFPLGWIHVSF